MKTLLLKVKKKKKKKLRYCTVVSVGYSNKKS